jgi:hypothetical protein
LWSISPPRTPTRRGPTWSLAFFFVRLASLGGVDNSKRCLFGRIVGRDHLRISTIKGAGGQNRSLARSQYPPRKFATEFPRSNSIVIKIIAWGKFPRLKITPNAKQGEREGKY